MKDQLDHLQELARRENIVIQVIPMKAPVCAQYTGPFVLASHNGESEVGYVDDAISGGVIENADEVARLRRTFEIFRGYALNRDESVGLIKETAQSWLN